MVAPRQKPPEVLDAGDIHLRRHRVEDAEGIAAAIRISVAELRQWMSWASDRDADAEFQRERLKTVVRQWDEGSDFSYVVEDDQDVILGVISLMARIGPGALEIGYWLRTDRTGRGIATSFVSAVTEAALALPDVNRVEIHCDEANVRSAAIPARLGYRLDRIDKVRVVAPGETGRSMVWIFPPK